MKRPVPDEVILGLLKSSPAHGYDLLEIFRSTEELGHVWTLSTSQIYAVLKRLENGGAIVGVRKESVDAPARIVYSVTETGSAQLESWLFDETPSSSIHRIRVLFLSRLYIANLLGRDIAAIVANQRIVCENQLEKLFKIKQETGSSFEGLTLDFVISQLESGLKWLDKCERALSKED